MTALHDREFAIERLRIALELARPFVKWDVDVHHDDNDVALLAMIDDALNRALPYAPDLNINGDEIGEEDG